MFRLATANDYEYLPDIGLYELTFDKRPVQGVRCEDPEQGAKQYNASRKRFKDIRRKERSHRENFTRLKEFSWDGIFDWCIERGTPEECSLVLAYYRSSNSDERFEIFRELSKHDGINRESDILIPMSLFSRSLNKVCDSEKIQSVELKATSR